ncbi:Asp23/Gls24 family envelope stress response protein [Streptacidiphilus sp. ASG 303]|uniref:Asp23/Gls24 family envelope stress response protein n=1 Tax=Streptacidiphilus sp. ASG 303 TaxID=2896847 RepID=UPI001E5C2663|nr:Asp23/Gls24 family envelope stress response protein [Streptacidiphilus sp. ASG 303]MCD0486154.1 Asp23/Gls24 family envelope stress response protein [Streptacidiphilus sp. ASG 303]
MTTATATATATATTVTTAGAAAGAGLPPPAERGATVLPDRVVARVAGRAAHEALAHRWGAAPGRLGLDEPGAEVSVRGGEARIALGVDLPYPVDIAGEARALQDAVARRVADLTGLRVGEVTVTVRRLVPRGAAAGRVR